MVKTPLDTTCLQSSTIQTLIKLIFQAKVTYEIIEKDPTRFGDLKPTIEDDLDYAESIVDACNRLGARFGLPRLVLPELETCDVAQLRVWRRAVDQWFVSFLSHQ